MGDLERLAGRPERAAGARDLVAIADGLERYPNSRSAGLRNQRGAGWLQQLLSPDPALAELAKTIRHSLRRPHRSLLRGDLI